MNVLTETVCETWELTLPDDDAKCTGYRDTCGRPAKWMLRISCGCSYLACDPCKRITDAIDAQGEGVHCGRPITWTWVPV